MRDAGNLLTRAGLAIPSVDVDQIQVHYRDAVQLVEHLRCGLGAGSVWARGSNQALLPARATSTVPPAMQGLLPAGAKGPCPALLFPFSLAHRPVCPPVLPLLQVHG